MIFATLDDHFESLRWILLVNEYEPDFCEAEFFTKFYRLFSKSVAVTVLNKSGRPSNHNRPRSEGIFRKCEYANHLDFLGNLFPQKSVQYQNGLTQRIASKGILRRLY